MMLSVKLFQSLMLLSIYTAAQEEVKLSLRYSDITDQDPPRDGMVFVEYGGISKTICNEGFDINDATVVCRQLGFDGYGIDLQGDKYEDKLPDSLKDQYWLTNLNCVGAETSITSCSYPGIDFDLDNCRTRDGNYASVVCLGELITTTVPTTTTVKTTTTPETLCDDPNPNIQLVDADNVVHAFEGRVQVREGGQWYGVCDDLWGKADAQVVARMLCYNPQDARAHVGGFKYGNRSADSYLFTEVRCAGDEDSIFDCPLSRDPSTCTIQESAAVSVQEKDDPEPVLPDAEAVCDGADETMHVSFEKSSNPGLTTAHLSLNDPDFADCATTEDNGTHVIITFSLIKSICGTEKTLNNDTYLIYKNQIRYLITSDTDITRQQIFLIDVICLMGRNGDPDNEVKPETVTVEPVYGRGEPLLELNIYNTTMFKDKITELPAKFRLGRRVAVAIELITDDDELKVVLQQCYATPDVSPDSGSQLFLIKDKCAVEDSVILYPVSETVYGFSFLIFEFSELEHEQLYLHCKGIVCGIREKYGRCDRTCGTGTGGYGSKRRRRNAEGYSEMLFSGAMDLSRSPREIGFEPTEFEADSGPIYILKDDEPLVQTSVIPPTQQATSTPTADEKSPVSDANIVNPDVVYTDIPQTQVPPTEPLLVDLDFPIASTAALIRLTLSLLLSILMALILS